MDVDVLARVAHVAVWVAWLTGASLCLVVLGAACEAMFPGSLAWTWAGFLSGLSVALRLFMLVSLAGLVYRLAVTYLHLGSGRHTLVKHGEHRPQTAARRHAEKTYNIRTV